jgi:uncharacterized protein YjlB
MGTLQHENQALGQRNAILEKNMSLLFATAQAEIARKDKTIATLREEVEQQQEGSYRRQMYHHHHHDHHHHRPRHTTDATTTLTETTESKRASHVRR